MSPGRSCDAAALARRRGGALDGADPAAGAEGGTGRGVMAGRNGERGEATALPSGPYVDWYETWLAQHGRRATAEAAARAGAERRERLIIRLFVGWAAVVTAATFASIWWMM